MSLQLGGLALKIPLSIGAGLRRAGDRPAGARCRRLRHRHRDRDVAAPCWPPSGCCATTRFYAAFETPLAKGRPALHRPDRVALLAQLRLGVPMGLTILIEVTGFSFMALFIARLGTAAVAGHQIAANLVALMFMMPLALGNATGTLVAQRIGAADLAAARRIGWHGVQIGMAIAALMGAAVFFGRQQCCSCIPTTRASSPRRCRCWPGWRSFISPMPHKASRHSCLRAWRIATAPLFIFVFALWGVGLGGGYLLAFDADNTFAGVAARCARILDRLDRRAGAGRSRPDGADGLGLPAADQRWPASAAQ